MDDVIRQNLFQLFGYEKCTINCPCHGSGAATYG